MYNPLFYIFDGITFALKWIGSNFEAVMIFLGALFLWYIPSIFEFMAVNGPRSDVEYLYDPWMEWIALGTAIFLAVNFFFWSKARVEDKREDKLVHHVFVGLYTGAGIFNVLLFTLLIVY